MREVVIPAGKKTERASSRDSPAGRPARPERRPARNEDRRRLRVRNQRDFLASYEGRFIGHYRACRPIPPRLAFGQLARMLRSRISGFLPEKLALYRPIKLKVKSPAGAEAAAAGDFRSFEGDVSSEIRSAGPAAS